MKTFTLPTKALLIALSFTLFSVNSFGIVKAASNTGSVDCPAKLNKHLLSGKSTVAPRNPHHQANSGTRERISNNRRGTI